MYIYIDGGYNLVRIFVWSVPVVIWNILKMKTFSNFGPTHILCGYRPLYKRVDMVRKKNKKYNLIKFQYVELPIEGKWHSTTFVFRLFSTSTLYVYESQHCVVLSSQSMRNKFVLTRTNPHEDIVGCYLFLNVQKSMQTQDLYLRPMYTHIFTYDGVIAITAQNNLMSILIAFRQ